MGDPVRASTNARPVLRIVAQTCAIVIVKGVADAVRTGAVFPPQSIVAPVVELINPGCGPLRPTQNAALVWRGAGAAIVGATDAVRVGAGATPPQLIVRPVVELTKPTCKPVRPTQNEARV